MFDIFSAFSNLINVTDLSLVFYFELIRIIFIVVISFSFGRFCFFFVCFFIFSQIPIVRGADFVLFVVMFADSVKNTKGQSLSIKIKYIKQKLTESILI